ncbi:MAG: glycosyltransferase family 87 protein [Pseudomonadota bacterium]
MSFLTSLKTRILLTRERTYHLVITAPYAYTHAKITSFFTSLKTGNWLTQERVSRIVIIALYVYAIALLFLVGFSYHGVDYQGRPLGTDFSNIYAAGKMALNGDAVDVYNYQKHYQMQQDVFAGQNIPFYGWHYPPFLLIIAMGLAYFPYVLALFIWQISTLFLFLLSIRIIVKTYKPVPLHNARQNLNIRNVPETKFFVLLALAFPAVFLNLGHGHTGFLCAALFGLGLLYAPTRPYLSGLFLGLLVFKPQFGVLIPIALIAMNARRTFFSASFTVLTLCVLTIFIFGFNIWFAFFESLQLTQNYVLETGATGWHKMQSLFAAVRMNGGNISAAYAAQATYVLVLAVIVFFTWRSRLSYDLKACLLLTASLLATPYMIDYDLVMLAPALCFFGFYAHQNGFLGYEKTLLAVTWTMPILARPIADISKVPFGFIMLSLFCLLILWRAYLEYSGKRMRQGVMLDAQA